MKVSLGWLRELIDYKLTPSQLADKLSLASIGVKEFTDDYLELDLTYNRGDLLSLRGVAREIAATTASKILFSAPVISDDNLPKTPVQIEDSKLSPIQCVAKIEGLKVGTSNKEWIKKLTDSGLRSVNNLVDVTNLIMLEFGQPLHAFDIATIMDETIIVRTATSGEEIITLDNKARKLTPQDIVLADTKGPIDVAGIMGGKGTEVKDSTTTILLSASMFNPTMVRKTSNRLGLTSEASKRFQHGLTKTNLLKAFAAAIKMYENLGGKLTAINLVGDLEEKLKTISLTQERINSLLGVTIKPEQTKEFLKKLGFTLASQGDTLGAWEVTIPYWRLDIIIEEDLIEEVARMYGYEKIDGKSLATETPIEIDQSFYNSLYDLKVKLKEVGLTEIQTYSFYSTQILEALGLQKDMLVKIANPISSETEYLRQSIWPNLLEVVAKNLRKGFKDIAVFEIGKAFNVGQDGKPLEDYRLAIALYNGTDNPIEELYQITQDLILHLILHLEGVRTFHLRGGKPPVVVINLFHPNRFVAVEKDGNQIGSLAEVHLRMLNKLGIEKRVAVLEIELDFLKSHSII